MPTTLAAHTDDLASLLGPPPPNAAEVLFQVFLVAATLTPALGFAPLPIPSVEARLLIAIICLGSLVSFAGLALTFPRPKALRTRETPMRVNQVGLGIAAAGSFGYGLLTAVRGSVDPLTTFLCAVITFGFLWRLSQINHAITHHRRLAHAFELLREDTDRLVRLLAPPTP